jgi:hypothetical protein
MHLPALAAPMAHLLVESASHDNLSHHNQYQSQNASNHILKIKITKAAFYSGLC